MPRRRPTRPDPSLSRHHRKGTKAVVTQVIEHEQLGVIAYEWPRLWPTFIEESRRARDAVKAVQARVARGDPGASDIRLIDPETLAPLLSAHVEMVVYSVLAIRYFVLELERVTGIGPTNPTDDVTRFRAACRAAALDDPAVDDRWSMVGELIDTRHRIEHPTEETVYSSGQWDRVPLAWSLTNRAVDCHAAFYDLFCDLADFWETRKQDFSNPGTLNVERGQRAIRPPKNPPTDEKK